MVSGNEQELTTGRHCLVSGRVQGVFFRASTQNEARRLGVTGSVRNLADGRVEVWAYGARGSVLALCEWLKTGPPHAQVQTVKCQACEYQANDQFRID